MIMKTRVNKDVCIGCGACNVIADGIFEMDDDGLAKAIVEDVPDDKIDEVKDASESCPTGAINIE